MYLNYLADIFQLDNASLVSAVCSESHYKYLMPLLIPLTSWFIIANWVGWEYFRYA
jgi:hypothetical protein